MDPDLERVKTEYRLEKGVNFLFGWCFVLSILVLILYVF